MPLELAKPRLSGKPYFDDFNEEKNFHRILFRPAVAVQARELNQIQSIFQNQIERFASHNFKEGSIVNGCAFQHHSNWNFLAVAPINDSARTTVVNEEGNPSIGEHLIGKTFVQRYPQGDEWVEARGTIVQVKLGLAGNGDPTKIFFVYDNDVKVSTEQDTSIAEPDGCGYPLTIYDSVERIVDRVKLTLNAASLVSKNDPTKIRIGDVIEGQTSRARAIVVDVGEQTSGTTPVLRSYLILERNYNTFIPGESISVVSRANNFSGIQVAQTLPGLNPVERQYGNEIGKIAPYSPSFSDIPPGTALTGTAFGITVQSGTIYQKGHFIRVESQSAVVNQFDSSPANKMVGFETEEEIITEYIDDSLYDNAIGTPNYTAPGAHRLRLTPKLLVINRDETSKHPGFLPLVEYGPDGAAFERTDPQYAALGDEMARRTYEESGNYTIRPFNVTTARNKANSELMEYRIGDGLAYVNGRRVETNRTFSLTTRKGIDTISFNSLGITTSYGNYVIVNNLVGNFNPESGQEVALYDTANGNAWLTGASLGNLSASITGTQIGTANIRHIEPISVGGTPMANTYRVYLFNIRMTGSNAFDAVRSIVVGTNPKAFADIVLESGKAFQYETGGTGLVWPIGLESVKNQRDANGNFDTTYYYQHAATATLALGSLTFTRADGFYTFDFDSNQQEAVTVIPTANVATNNLVGTVTVANGGTTVSGTGTQFKTDYAPGDAIKIDGNNYFVASVDSDTSLTIATPATQEHTSQPHSRWFFAGVPINIRALNSAGTAPLRPITVAGDDSNFSLSIPSSNGYATSASVKLFFRAVKGTSSTPALPLQKKVNRNTLVKIDTATGAGLAGLNSRSWKLGLPDVIRLNGIWVGANTTHFDTTTDVSSDFELDSGQAARAYQQSSVSLKPSVDATKYANKFLLISVDHFTVLTPASSDRAGYFSIESYPIDDTKPVGSRDENTIRTEEVPIIKLGGQTLDLRNCIDFRPYITATAAVTKTHSTATVNPADSTTFQSVTTAFDPLPAYGRFTTNATQYVGRREIIAINEEGKFVTISGAPAKNPKLPVAPVNYLQIATVNIPPYPSYAYDEQTQETSARFSSAYNVTIKKLESRRWTMRDITAIEQRVSRLEYYTSLNALEIKAKDMLIVDANGDNRFKNGFLVDNFNDITTGRVDYPEYRITIDKERGMAVPLLFPEVYPLELDLDSSRGIRVTGDMVTYDYTEEPFITQPYATRVVAPPPPPPPQPEPPRPVRCTDPRAKNYGQIGGCVYEPEPIRCMDPRALNYNEIIGPNGSCVYEVAPAVCMDPTAENFGGALPCRYPAVNPIPPCGDPNALNFGANAPCVYPPVEKPKPRQYSGNVTVSPSSWAVDTYVDMAPPPGDSAIPLPKPTPILPPNSLVYDPVNVGAIPPNSTNQSSPGFVPPLIGGFERLEPYEQLY